MDPKLLLDGTVVDGKLILGERTYDHFIISVFNVVNDEVAKKVIEMVEKGVRVHIIKGNCAISSTTGKASAYAEQIAQLIAEGKIFADGDGDVAAALDANFTGGLIRTESRHDRLMTHCRITEDGVRVIFATNMGYEPISDSITIPEKYTHLYKVDPEAATVEEMAFAETGNGTRFALDLEGIKANIYILE